MIITILIVLVLLFVLYRMMPGSAAASMMMNPKMTQNEINQVMVRYGFGQWADYPGEYKTANLAPETVGRYSITVIATDDAGQTDTIETYIDVDPLPEMDYVSPRVLDIGFTNAVLGQKGEFYLHAYDVGAMRSVEAVITYPNETESADGGFYTEKFILNQLNNMTDAANGSYYYTGITPGVLTSSYDGNANFKITFSATDRARNVGTASMSFNATTGTVIHKLWGTWINIPFSITDETYSYYSTGDTVQLTSKALGAAPTFSMAMSDLELVPVTTVADAVNNYNGSFSLPENGILTLTAQAGGIYSNFSFPVNSDETVPPAPSAEGTSTSPNMGDLVISVLNEQDREVPTPNYPYVLSTLRLRINATATDADGVMCTNVTAIVVRPDGSSSSILLKHPNYVEMRSMAAQFVTYMKTMLVFDFGTSYIYQRPAWDVILDRVPSTALLFGMAMIVSDVLGIIIGVIVAWRRGTVLEMGTIIVTLFFYSMPIFWFALIMQWVFYAQLDWFPLAGMGGITPDGVKLEGLTWFLDVMWHLTMPLITLVILGLAGTILLMRSSMLEVIGEDFTTTAKAKGLKERTVVFKHVARNAMLPVVTSMAMSIGSIISGGVLTETIFSWYGMGTLLIEGTLSKDFPVVQGAFYILALLTIFGNMAADLLYAWLDPRVQL